jgi:hypothetical protein
MRLRYRSCHNYLVRTTQFYPLLDKRFHKLRTGWSQEERAMKAVYMVGLGIADIDCDCRRAWSAEYGPVEKRS